MSSQKTEQATRIFNGSSPIDHSSIKFSAPKVNPKGGKVVSVLNKHFNNESLEIETPMIFTWGSQERLDQEQNPTGNFTMSLQFPNADNYCEQCNNFLVEMQRIEQLVKDTAMERSNEWFGKVIKSAEVIDEKFNIMLRHPKIKNTEQFDLSKPPTLTVKFPCWKGVWQTEVYDENGNPLFLKSMSSKGKTPLEFIEPRIFVKVLLQCGGIWFVNGKISITWNAKQIVVKNSEKSTEGTCLLSIEKERFTGNVGNLSGYDNEKNNVGKKATTQSLTIIDDDESDGDNNKVDENEGDDGVQSEEKECVSYENSKKRPFEN
jgi:hypothetical protein